MRKRKVQRYNTKSHTRQELRDVVHVEKALVISWLHLRAPQLLVVLLPHRAGDLSWMQRRKRMRVDTEVGRAQSEILKSCKEKTVEGGEGGGGLQTVTPGWTSSHETKDDGE